MHRHSATTLPIAAALLTLPLSSHAYLDPGTGSLLLQGLIAGIAAVGFTVKLYWYRIKAFFKNEKPPEATDADQEPWHVEQSVRDPEDSSGQKIE